MSTEAPKKAPIGLGWKVRERRDSDGELLDCFLEAPRVEGMAYGLEVLGDDYTGYDGVQGKLKHCQMIAAWANAAPASSEPVAWVRRHPDGALTSAFLEHAVIDPVRKDSGAWVPLYTAPVAVRISTAWRESLEVLILNYGTACIDKDGGKTWGEIKSHLDKFTIPVAAQPDLTQQTLDDVKAGIPARDAEIEALRNELETLQAQMKNPVVVHSNMCRGIIAPITFDMLAHVLGDEAKQEWLASQAQQPVSGADGLPIELRGIAEAIGNGGGFWRSCSGCHESNEGMATGPFSETLKCHLGVGCSECGGIGAIWDTTDYDAMADFMAAEYQQRTENTEPVGQGQLRDAAQMIESSGNSGELPRLPLNDPAAAYRVLHDYGQSCAHAALALSHPDTATYQQAKAWKAVCAALDFVNPRWAEEDGTGEECAVKAIVSLAQQDADKVDAALAEMVHAMFRSGNSVPVTRITIDRKQYDAAIDAARKEQA